MCSSEHDAWPVELREAWDNLTTPEQRLLLRARWRWRAWPNPGPNPPKPPQQRYGLHRALTLLYAQELAYRQRSACRGAEGEYANSIHHREDGHRAPATPADMLAILAKYPEGLTVTELYDHLPPGMSRETVAKWLKYAGDFGQARSERRGAAFVWFPVGVMA